MTTFNEEEERDRRRVVLAWVVLALQIIIFIWLLLFARDRLAFGSEPQATPAPTAVAAAAEPATTAEPAGDGEAGGTDATAATPTGGADAAEATVAAEATATPEPADETEATAPGQTAAEAGVIAPDEVTVDPPSLDGGAQAPEWLAQLVEGRAAGTPAGTGSVPPHLLLTVRDPLQPDMEPAAPDQIDLGQPQIRIVPLTALLAWLQARADTAGEEALEDLQSLLDDPPPVGEAVVPASPLLGEVEQALAARLSFEEFNGGRGVGYVAHVTANEATPLTKQSGLHYFFQGLTSDGRHYVFMSWPVAAGFLDESANSSTTAALASDPAAYYNTIAAQVEEASDDELTPAPARLQRMIGSLVVGGAAAAQDGPVVTPATPADAAGIVWSWTASRGGDGDETTVARPPDYSLAFWPDGSFSFAADCNVGRGTYSIDAEGALSLMPGAMTRAACPSDSQADEFLQTLAGARGLAFDESGDMILTLADGREAIFANAGPADMAAAAESDEQPGAADAGFTGLNLQWPGFTDAGGNTITVDDPERYSLILLPDGTYSLRADCNIGSGTFEYAEDGALVLLPGPITRVACPEGSQADAFLAFLSGVSGVAVAEDGAVTMTAADGSSATFISAGPVSESTTGSGTTTATDGELLDTVWQWRDLRAADGTTTEVGDPERYTLSLLDDGTYVFVADCNRGAGGYTLDGTALTLNPGPVTLAACESGSLSDVFIDLLGQIRDHSFDDENLLLTLADGSVATLGNGGPVAATGSSDPSGGVAGPTAAPLAGIVWRWATFRDAKQDYIVPASAEYTLVFNDDGTVNVVADCNVANGTYTVNTDGTLTLAILLTTAAACPPESLGDSFIEYLNQAGPFQVDEDGSLIIDLRADGGTMTFVPTP